MKEMELESRIRFFLGSIFLLPMGYLLIYKESIIGCVFCLIILTFLVWVIHFILQFYNKFSEKNQKIK